MSQASPSPNQLCVFTICFALVLRVTLLVLGFGRKLDLDDEGATLLLAQRLEHLQHMSDDTVLMGDINQPQHRRELVGRQLTIKPK